MIESPRLRVMASRGSVRIDAYVRSCAEHFLVSLEEFRVSHSLTSFTHAPLRAKGQKNIGSKTPTSERSKMGSIKVILPEDLEKEFRQEVFKQMGMKKGNLTIAIEEAIRAWTEERRRKRSRIAKKAWEKRKSKGRC